MEKYKPLRETQAHAEAPPRMTRKPSADATLWRHFNDRRSGAVAEPLKKPWTSGFYFFHCELTISYEAGNIEVLA